MIGRPVIVGDRQRRATAGVAVELGQDDAGEVDALLERLGRLDRGLADHRVDDEEDLVGLDRRADVGGLLHEVLVDGEAAGGVDDDDVVLAWRGPARCPARETATGSPNERVPSPESRTASWPPTLPRSGANTGTPARSPTTSSWVTALGRWRSAATSSGVCPWSLSQLAELAGEGRLARALQAGEHDDRRRRSWRTRSCGSGPPRIPTSSSLTILTTCWAGLSAWLTSAPSARSRTARVNCLTTGSATSASSRASRMSRIVALTSDSESRPLPRRFLKVRSGGQRGS